MCCEDQTMTSSLLIGKGTKEVNLLSNMVNRHGLIAGATGTGKTITLKVLAENLSALGVPVFMADVKGDLASIAIPGAENEKIAERVKKLQLPALSFRGFPVTFWDLNEKNGHPVRATISDMGPLLLSRLLNLNDTQSGVLQIAFKAADDNGFLILDLKDLRAMLEHIGTHAKEFTTSYGNVSSASIGAIQRAILALSEQGAERFFGEPALNIDDLLQTASDSCGIINVLAAETLLQSPRIYSTFLLWLLAELFEHLPEVGDLEKPKLVFFFDEAHLLFEDAPKVFLDKIEQVVRLIRSKGVGVFFITQSPLDIPDNILGQLGNRVQHALRAFTEKDRKALKAVADNFRSDGSFDILRALGELAVGEALVSFLDEKGTPQPVTRALICPPRSRIGTLETAERAEIMKSSLVAGQYENSIDRESAFELLKKRVEQKQETLNETQGEEPIGRKSTRDRQGPLEAFIVSAARAVGSQVGRQIIRGILGSVLGGKR